MKNADRRWLESCIARRDQALNLAKRCLRNGNTDVAVKAFKLYRTKIRDIEKILERLDYFKTPGDSK